MQSSLFRLLALCLLLTVSLAPAFAQVVNNSTPCQSGAGTNVDPLGIAIEQFDGLDLPNSSVRGICGDQSIQGGTFELRVTEDAELSVSFVDANGNQITDASGVVQLQNDGDQATISALGNIGVVITTTGTPLNAQLVYTSNFNQNGTANFTVGGGQTCPTVTQGVDLTTQDDVDDLLALFPDCELFPGNITITGSVTDLSALSQLTGIAGTLELSLTNRLTDLIGLGSITSTAGLNINGATMLETLADLTSLSSLRGGNLLLTNNTMLTDLTGLSPLAGTTINDILITGNTVLEGCADQTNLCGYTGSAQLGNNGPSGCTTTEFTAACNSLPVELLTFVGRRNGKQNQLEWTVANEEALAGYGIERSYDLRDWSELTFTPATAPIDGYYAYADRDAEALTRTAYYRLRQQDVDGSVVYSGIVQLDGSASGAALTALPNPTTGALELRGITEAVRVQVLSITGEQVLDVRLAPGERMDLSTVARGSYLLRVTGDGLNQVLRVVRQ